MEAETGIPDAFLEELYGMAGNRVALLHLVEQINNSPVTVFAGSAISVPAGYPPWNEFVQQLGKQYRIVTPDILVTADRLVQEAGEMLFYDSVEEVYGFIGSDPRAWRGAIRVLPYLSNKVITLNLDNALEAVYEYVGTPFLERCSWVRPPAPAPPLLWKLRGIVEDRGSILATTERFESLSSRERAIGDEMAGLIASDTLLAIGVDSSDLADWRFLAVLAAAQSPGYAVMDASLPEPDRRNLSKRALRAIRCPDLRGDGGELLCRHLLQQMRDRRIPAPPRPLPPYTPSTKPRPPAEARPAAVPAAPPAPELPPFEVPPELVQSCVAGECVLFAGSGLSARAGIATWNRFLIELIAYTRGHDLIDEGYASSLHAALAEGDRDATADGLFQAFGTRRQLFQDFLRQACPESVPLAPAHEYLRQTPFAAVVTTNYDNLLEKAFPEYAQDGLFTSRDAEPLLDALSQKRRFILKLYGVMERPETLIFAPIEYREVLSSNIPFSKFMEGFFFSRNFLFLGLSLEGVQEFLSGFVFRGTSPRKHFALVAVAGSAWKAKAELLLRRYNIQVIPFPVSPSFAEVDTFVETLSHATRPVAPLPGAPVAAPAPPQPGVRRLVLEDIGTFERLEIDFPKDRNWKIVLGDNGVGKSTILKAIATAIMGSDARSYAARLVRAGKTRGRITLITEQNPTGYITDILTKDMLSEAEIVSIPARPMEAEGWLALGFSPLRIVTWSSPSGPQPVIQKGRPSADDLLPLISGESDPRMDRLKQWIVNLDAADKPGQARSLVGHTGRVSALAFSPDGSTLVSGSIDNTVRIWNCATGQELRRIEAHPSGVNAVAVTADGGAVISGSYDKTAKLWAFDSGHHLRTFHASHTQILCVAVSANGQALVTGSEAGSVRVWSLKTGSELRWIGTSAGPVWAVAVTPDGHTIAAGCDNGAIKLYDLETARELRSIETATGGVWSVAASPAGPLLASGSADGTVALWDLQSGASVRSFRDTSAGVLSVAFSADGRMLAAGAENGLITAWEVASGRKIFSLQAHPDAVWCVAFAPDGRTLASGSNDKNVRLWNVPTATLSSGQETIRRFFRLVGVLTDRNDIDFLQVTENFRVMVKIAEAPGGVPLEVLSQGMTSLLGWVGVLCQRLKETLERPTQDPLPTDSFALVLIDEIDAHMHPQWQQTLVHRLKKAFPNVQFVACTHSPLIVGGLDKDEVERLAVRDGKMMKVNFDPDMTLGRTDQILTGQLFGLPTTLDPATQGLISEYEELLGEPHRDPAQESRFRELGRLLEERIPPTPSEPVKRRARELLEALQAGGNGDRQALIEERMSRLSRALRGETE